MAMGLCGEMARERLTPPEGSGTYRTYIIDAVYQLTPNQLEKGGKYEIDRKQLLLYAVTDRAWTGSRACMNR